MCARGSGCGEKRTNECIKGQWEGLAIEKLSQRGLGHFLLMEHRFKRDLIERGGGSQEHESVIFAEVSDAEKTQVLVAGYTREKDEADPVAAIDFVAIWGRLLLSTALRKGLGRHLDGVVRDLGLVLNSEEMALDFFQVSPPS